MVPRQSFERCNLNRQNVYRRKILTPHFKNIFNGRRQNKIGIQMNRKYPTIKDIYDDLKLKKASGLHDLNEIENW